MDNNFIGMISIDEDDVLEMTTLVFTGSDGSALRVELHNPVARMMNELLGNEEIFMSLYILTGALAVRKTQAEFLLDIARENELAYRRELRKKLKEEDLYYENGDKKHKKRRKKDSKRR